MTIAQDIRNAYDWRDREGLERLLKKVDRLEQLVASGQLLFSPIDRCTCQSGPNWRALIGAIGEPCKCPDCLKPITLLAGEPLHTAAVGIPLDMAGIQVGVTTPAMYRSADSNDDRGASRGPVVCTCGAIYGYPHNEGCAKA